MSGRFAPTPSGRMHIGNVYAMLAAWLSARSQPQGRIALRIEDIDTPRVVPDADRLIMDDLAWLGLDWDGDPVYQSRRDDLYREAFRTLRGDGGLGESRVFPCFCSRADIRAASAPQEGDGFSVYPGTCRRRWADDPDDVRLRLERGDRHAWRVAVPAVGHAGDDGDSGKNRSDGCDCCDVSGGNNGNTGDMGDSVTFQDRVFGPQRFVLSRDVGDAVVLRSDGLFSYQLAVVVDDLLMGVDDIVRGRDLLPSTALQMWIRRLLLDRGFGADAAGLARLPRRPPRRQPPCMSICRSSMTVLTGVWPNANGRMIWACCAATGWSRSRSSGTAPGCWGYAMTARVLRAARGPSTTRASGTARNPRLTRVPRAKRCPNATRGSCTMTGKRSGSSRCRCRHMASRGRCRRGRRSRRSRGRRSRGSVVITCCVTRRPSVGSDGYRYDGRTAGARCVVSYRMPWRRVTVPSRPGSARWLPWAVAEEDV